MEAYVLSIRRDDNGKWGFGEANVLDNTIIIGTTFDYVLIETLKLLELMKDTLRGKDRIVEQFSNNLAVLFKNITITTTEFLWYEIDGWDGDCISLSKEHEEFSIDWDCGDAYLHLCIEKKEITTNIC